MTDEQHTTSTAPKAIIALSKEQTIRESSEEPLTWTMKFFANRYIRPGDMMADRNAQKGICTKTLPETEMSYVVDGTESNIAFGLDGSRD